MSVYVSSAKERKKGEEEELEDIKNLHEWLLSHGARYDAVVWPSNDTKSGSRGAVASADIDTNEYILQIPIKCMLSPLHAYADPIYGDCLMENRDLLAGDALLAVYIMIEVNKGSQSFYYPYLKTVPDPASACHWNRAEIDLLQDFQMVSKIRAKKHFIRRLYEKVIMPLCEKTPELFPSSMFTFERFRFAWDTIQARS
jgi:hypothetical protein